VIRSDSEPSRMLPIPPPGAYCEHDAMSECCDGCGHFSCPCGVSWDESAEGDS